MKLQEEEEDMKLLISSIHKTKNLQEEEDHRYKALEKLYPQKKKTLKEEESIISHPNKKRIIPKVYD